MIPASVWGDCLHVLLVAMLPVVELRGSIILGASLSLPWYLNYLVSVCGTMLPVPFILLFIRAILRWMKTVPRLSGFALWLEEKAHKKSKRMVSYEFLGLFLFVAIPIPGTGAWTGSLIAALMDLRMKLSLPTILAGVLVAGFIMCGASYGFLGFLRFLMA